MIVSSCQVLLVDCAILNIWFDCFTCIASYASYTSNKSSNGNPAINSPYDLNYSEFSIICYSSEYSKFLILVKPHVLWGCAVHCVQGLHSAFMPLSQAVLTYSDVISQNISYDSPVQNVYCAFSAFSFYGHTVPVLM